MRWPWSAGDSQAWLPGARLKETGIGDVGIVEKGGGFGGTRYWNRYPGAQCDTSAMIYMQLLEETGHMPSERYVRAPEILEHCDRIAKHYGLHDDTLLHTQVTDLEWDVGRCRWIVRANRGDEFTAQFVGMGTGTLHVAKLPGIPGIGSFTGHAFYTSRWDYAYTGGDPEGSPLDGLSNKRVAITDTGATAVLCLRTSPGPASSCSSSSGRHRRWTCATTSRSTPSGSPSWQRPAGSSAGWTISSPTWPPANGRPRTRSTTGGPTKPSGSAAAQQLLIPRPVAHIVQIRAGLSQVRAGQQPRISRRLRRGARDLSGSYVR